MSFSLREVAKLTFRYLPTLICVCVLFGCTPSNSTNTLHIVISGDTAGWITPCGCAINQSGGLERRASLLQELGPKEKRLYLDVGGSASGTSEYQQVKLNSILQGDRDMGLELHNIGFPETQFAPKALDELGRKSDVKWLSANLETTERSDLNNKPTFVTHKVIERAGLRILVTGVIDSALLKNPQWRAKDPASCILEVLAKQKVDVVLVLAYMDEPGLRALAESLPEVDYIVGGPTGQSLTPSRVGAVQILSATNKGKFLSHIELKPSPKRWEQVRIGSVEVSSSIARDPNQSDNIDRYLATLAKKDFIANETGLITTPKIQTTNHYQIAGSKTCNACHKSDDQTWHASKHAHAWQTLIDKKWHVDPACQQCHTTGYGLPGGFSQVSESQAMGNVGCESCHGPSLSHVNDPKIRTPYLAREQCIRCHDHENSPEFAFPAYWGKVQHGKQNSSL